MSYFQLLALVPKSEEEYAVRCDGFEAIGAKDTANLFRLFVFEGPNQLNPLGKDNDPLPGFFQEYFREECDLVEGPTTFAAHARNFAFS